MKNKEQKNQGVEGEEEEEGKEAKSPRREEKERESEKKGGRRVVTYHGLYEELRRVKKVYKECIKEREREAKVLEAG